MVPDPVVAAVAGFDRAIGAGDDIPGNKSLIIVLENV